MRNSKCAKCMFMLTFITFVLCGTLWPTGVEAAEQKSQPGTEELGKITSLLKVMDNYIRITQEFYSIANDHERAAAFAVMEIKSVYEQSGNREGAIKELTDLLSKTDNRTIRNIIRFQLLDLYKQSKNTQAAMENLTNIINENLK